MNMNGEQQHQVFFGDSRCMSEIADASVQLVVTSPPYWQLKDYGSEGQIGFHQSLPEYIQSLNEVWRECYRVLDSGCRLCVNIGDQFARAAHYGRYKVIPLHQDVIAGCETIGFDYMGAIIWQKATTMNTSGGGAVMGSFPHPRNGILKIDYEFILLFKKLGNAPKVSPAKKAASAMTTAEWNQYFSGHWNFSGEKQGDGHIAMFPLELPRRLIKMFSFAGERVLDPFLGSGTTIRAAMELGREGVGYEVNRDFAPIIRKKLGVEHHALFTCDNVLFQESQARSVEVERVLISPHESSTRFMERQVDPKQFRFGSIIEKDDAQKPRQRGMKVTRILQPDRLRTADGGEIQLLGIKPLLEKTEQALSYLHEMVLNENVFLKFDDNISAENGALRAYVYLGNKTFINAKLIKYGLVEVDFEAQHRLAQRFRAYQTGKNNV